MNSNSSIKTFDSNAAALANILKKWRGAHNYSLAGIACFENRKKEDIMRVEEGIGNMSELLVYLDFIRIKDRPFLDKVMTEWCYLCGYE